MGPTRLFTIIAWILLPTVMFGGYSLLQLLIDGNVLTPFQVTFFRAGHGHAGVLILVALLFHSYLDRTTIVERVKWLACTAMLIGIMFVSGGFFLHMVVGQPGQSSVGTPVTTAGAVLLSLDILLLVYGLIKSPRTTPLP
jgi:hypothetical protein